MEKRNIQISLEQAREWYDSKNEALRRLALSVFTKEELTEPQTFEEVCQRLEIGELNFHWESLQKEVAKTMEKTRVSLKLGLIATYFNKDWQPKAREKNYFIAWGTYYSPTAVVLENGFSVIYHETAIYPGIVYFKTQEDAVKAFNMLKDEMKALYRYE